MRFFTEFSQEKKIMKTTDEELLKRYKKLKNKIEQFEQSADSHQPSDLDNENRIKQIELIENELELRGLKEPYENH